MSEPSLPRFQIPRGNLPDPTVAAELFVQWCTLLARTRLGLQDASSGTEASKHTYRFGQSPDKTFTLARDIATDTWALEICTGVEETAIASVVSEALARTATQDSGDDIIYQAELVSRSFTLSPGFQLHMMRLLGDQVRISGPRRLSDRILLEFVEELPDNPPPLLFAPNLRIKVTVFAPGPVNGTLAQRVASGLVETAAAICAFAIGRVVDKPLLIGFPLLEAEAVRAREMRLDPSIRGLARAGVSLDIFGDLARLGGMDAALRGRAAFITLHEALVQTNPDVATILFVTAIEALIAPTQPWGRDRVVKRFVEGVLSLCEPAVDSALAHANVEQAFQFRKRGKVTRQRQDLVERIYDLRSHPSHRGVSLSGGGTLGLLVGDGTMRLAILSDLARGALLGYLAAPRSFLAGHPTIDPRPLESS